MNLGLRELATFLAKHKNDQALVLATVTATEGSSYRKPGAMMLIRANHEFAGLISGGCLEGDLVSHATAVFSDGQPRQVTYDLSSDDDTMLGLGLGCGGIVHLLLQRLDRDHGFGFLPALFESARRRLVCLLALVRQTSGNFPAGSWAMINEVNESSGISELGAGLGDQLRRWSNAGRFAYSGTADSILLVKIDPSPVVLICGAGPDAVPVANQVDQLGWESTVVDHRSAYARSDRFPDSTTVLNIQPDELYKQVDLDQVNAAIVMSHNLVHDRTYLAQLASRKLPYLGLLGPKARREQLQVEMSIGDQVIHGPVGFDIGAELPESIALSIMAEIHAVLFSRDVAGDE